MASGVEYELQRMQGEYQKAVKQFYALKSKDLLIDNELGSWQVLGKQMTEEFQRLRKQLDQLQGANMAPERFATLTEFEDNFGMERFFASLKSTTAVRIDNVDRGPDVVDLRQRSMALDRELQDLKQQLEAVDAQFESFTEEERFCETLQEQLKQSNQELADLKQEAERLKSQLASNEKQLPNPVLRKDSFFSGSRSGSVKPKTVRFSLDSECDS